MRRPESESESDRSVRILFPAMGKRGGGIKEKPGEGVCAAECN